MADAHKRKRHPKYKTRYRIKNWPVYEEGLKARGDITLWFSEDIMDATVIQSCLKKSLKGIVCEKLELCTNACFLRFPIELESIGVLALISGQY